MARVEALRTMTKYLFLDIDGVLNTDDFLHKARTSGAWASSDYGDMIDHFHVGILKNILDECKGVQVILSSAWRLIPGVSETSRLLRKAGMGNRFYFDGETPANGRRGQEIKAYIDENKIDPADICIIDDDTDIDPLKHRWVRTLPNEGLTPEKAAQAIDMLKGKL